jgi:hypothetical protein
MSTINLPEKMAPVCERCRVKDHHRGGRIWRDVYHSLEVDAKKCNECGARQNTSLNPCGHWLCEKHAPQTAFSAMMSYIGLADRDTHNSRSHKKDPCGSCGAFECRANCDDCHRNRVCECYKCCKQLCEWCHNTHKKRGLNCPSCGDMQCGESFEKCVACDETVCLKCYGPDKCNRASVTLESSRKTNYIEMVTISRPTYSL